ncbi:hypothetical protein GCM10011594_17460 [Nakamurella endophytica]|uniref:HTH gntR-type domain-containing protein n=1 Tax=Nakamurella endophytica TaxID=1748367 RepID=A0A917SVA9_9ACTN|nr:hypothetical protein GCM10011594_17460 [Nakamurella endophytica]
MARQALWEGVYRAVRQRILTLAIAPGTRLSESGLAQEFDLSPTPVRDALGRLMQEGLVVSGRERGYWVAGLDIGDLQQLAAFRYILERGVAELLVADPPDYGPLREHNAALRAPGLTLDEVVDVNADFHMGLAELTGNQRLVRTLRRVLEDSARYFRVGAHHYSAAQMADDHDDLVDALVEADMARVGRHLHHEAFGTRDRVMDVLVRSPRALSGLIGTPLTGAHRGPTG